MNSSNNSCKQVLSVVQGTQPLVIVENVCIYSRHLPDAVRVTSDFGPVGLEKGNFVVSA